MRGNPYCDEDSIVTVGNRTPIGSRMLIGLCCIGLLGIPACGDGGSRRPDPMDASRGAAKQLLGRLEAYYGGPEVLRETWLVPPDREDQLPGLRYLAERMARALVWGDSFVVGAMGSSVTAGTGSCNYDSYPRQLERLLSPVFAAGGVELEVRNAGQGGNCGDSFRNQIWCARTLLGDDIDVAHYSWTYFEEGEEDPPAYHEMFYRWVLQMEHGPVPELIYTHNCQDLPPADRQLLDRYSPFGVNILCMTRGIEGVGYPGKEWGVVGDSLHDTTRYGEILPIDSARRRSLGVVFRNWHPGPLLFQTTADALAYKYLKAWLLALDLVEREAAPRANWPEEASKLRPTALPTPMVCDPKLCAVESPPRCAYYAEPRYGSHQVDLKAPSLAVGQPNEAECGKEPGEVDRGWYIDRIVPDFYMPDEERGLVECEPLDRCGGVRAQSAVTPQPLVFRLPSLDVGRIQVCCSAKRCGESLLRAGAEFTVDGQQVQSPVALEKCVVLTETFSGKFVSDAPLHEVRIVVPARKDPLPGISHVFGL